MKAATIALAICIKDGKPIWVDTFSDGREIQILETSVQEGKNDPLKKIYDQRVEQTLEDEKFSDYVEGLLSYPFVKPDIQEHGLQWMKSKIRIERYEHDENDAAKIIAEYAFRVYCGDSSKVDFLLTGPTAQVRVRIFVVQPSANDLAA